MRSELRRVADAWGPVTRRLRSRSGSTLTVLCWHRVDDAPGPLSVTTSQLVQALDVLDAHGAQVLRLEEAWDRSRTGTLPDRAVALTFDDGYLSFLDTAWPLLRDRGWPATAYLVSGFLAPGTLTPWDVEAGHPAPLVTEEQVAGPIAAGVSDGLDVGSHTVTHRWLPSVPDHELDDELLQSRLRLEELVGRPVRTLAYPAGHSEKRVRAAAERAGYDAAFSTLRGCCGRRTRAMAAPRTVVPRDAEDLARVLDGAYDFLRPLDAAREAAIVRASRKTRPDRG